MCLSILLPSHLIVCICLSVHLSVYLSFCPSIHKIVCVSVYLTTITCDCLYWTVCPFVCLSIFQSSYTQNSLLCSPSVYTSFLQFACLSILPSVYLSVCLSIQTYFLLFTSLDPFTLGACTTTNYWDHVHNTSFST